MMEFGRRSFPLPSFNPTRQKQRLIAQQNFQATRFPSQLGNGGSVDSQIANLKQCISAYLDSIQMVCRAGSWLAETFSFLLSESSAGSLADEMKTKFTKILQLSLSTTLQAKNDLAIILSELSLPNINHAQAIKDCKIHNAKVLENCIQRLSDVHNVFFKIQINVESDGKTEMGNTGNHTTAGLSGDAKIEASMPAIERASSDYTSEWEKLGAIDCNSKSWLALKERNNGFLRKYNGLTETEIQNLLKHETVSELYLQKLNQRIDTALRNYEVGLRNLPTESSSVFGGFYSSPEDARRALKGCCSQMEIEQGTQRLPVSQFLHCELPLMTVTINRKEHSADANNSSGSINLKKNAIRQLLQSSNQKLSISETDDLSSEILGDVCPARWRTHVKACLQLLYGNSGLIIMDTMSSESNTKQNAVITHREGFIVVSVTSTWCLKEDPGTMSLLQRNLDPEKSLAMIHVRYVSVFSVRATANKRFHPGMFVETFVQTGTPNRRRASRSLRATRTLYGVPLTRLSACWLTDQPILNSSPIASARVTSSPASTEGEFTPKLLSAKFGTSKSDIESGSSSERKRKKKLVVEIKEGDTSSEEEKSSDNEDSVKDVIQLLSGCSRSSTRRKQIFSIVENDSHGQETDEMSKATEDILDSDVPDLNNGTEVVSSEIKMKASISETSPKVPDNLVTNSSSHPQRFPLREGPAYPTGAAMEQAIIQQRMKSKTLPGSFGSDQQRHQEIDHLKSSSNTLPHGHARNPPWGPHPSHHSVAMNQPQMPLGFLYPNPRQFSQSFNSHDDLTLSPAIVCSSLKPQALTPYPNTSSPVSCQVGAPPDQNRGSSPRLTYGNWLHGTTNQEFTQTSDYDPKHASNPVRALLHGVANLSVAQATMQGEHSQRLSKNNMAMQRNSNNNNMLSCMGPPANEATVNSLQYPSSSYQTGVFGETINHLPPKTERKLQTYSPEVRRTAFLKMQEKQVGEMVERGFGVDDHFVMSRSQECLGPIGSPIIKRQSKSGVSNSQPPSQSSNTWPFVQHLHLQEQATGITSGESEYRQYVVEVAKNAILRKQVTRNADAENRDLGGNRLWNDKNTWPSHHNSNVYPNSFPTFHESESIQPSEQCAKDNENDEASKDIKETDYDMARTGTWPPWQLWSSGNSLWNWSGNTTSADIRDDCR